jgi:hypothetical protein
MVMGTRSCAIRAHARKKRCKGEGRDVRSGAAILAPDRSASTSQKSAASALLRESCMHDFFTFTSHAESLFGVKSLFQKVDQLLCAIDS